MLLNLSTDVITFTFPHKFIFQTFSSFYRIKALHYYYIKFISDEKKLCAFVMNILCFKRFYRPWYAEVATPEPKDIVIVLDKSDSMKIDGKLNLTKKATYTLLKTFNPNDRVSLKKYYCIAMAYSILTFKYIYQI